MSHSDCPMELAIDTGRLDVTHSKAVLSMSLHFQNLVRVVKSTTDSIFDTLCRSACCEPAVLDLKCTTSAHEEERSFLDLRFAQYHRRYR